MQNHSSQTDDTTTLQALKDNLTLFRDSRGWSLKFHTPRNLATSVAIEAAELLEHFQWKEDYTPEQLREISDEMSDILSYLLDLVDVLGIDMATAFFSKRARVEEKYPTTIFNPNTDAPDQYNTIHEKHTEPIRRIRLQGLNSLLEPYVKSYRMSLI